MGLFSTLGGFLGGMVGFPTLGAGIGSLVDGGISSRESKANAQAGRLDLGYLRKEALENGFNPSSVLRYTGGAGSTTVGAGAGFFSSSAVHFNSALSDIYDRHDRGVHNANTEALTELYKAETQVASGVVSRSTPVFGPSASPSSGGMSRVAPAAPSPSTGLFSGGRGGFRYSDYTPPPVGQVGDPPTGPIITATSPSGQEEIGDNGRTGWEFLGVRIRPFPGISDAQTLETRGSEPLAWAGGIATLIVDPIYTAVTSKFGGIAGSIATAPIEFLGGPVTVNAGPADTYEFGVEP